MTETVSQQYITEIYNNMNNLNKAVALCNNVMIYIEESQRGEAEPIDARQQMSEARQNVRYYASCLKIPINALKMISEDNRLKANEAYKKLVTGGFDFREAMENYAIIINEIFSKDIFTSSHDVT